MRLLLSALLLLFSASSAWAKGLDALQAKVDMSPSFDNISSLLMAMLEQEKVSDMPVYLTLLQGYQKTEQQRQQVVLIKGLRHLALSDICQVQPLLAELKSSNDDLYLQLSQAFWQWQQAHPVGQAALNCIFRQSRSLILSRGLLRSQSLYLDIKFELDSARLTENGQQQLSQLVASLSSLELQHFDLVVTGHADEQGPQDYNLTLSKARADSVARFIRFHLQPMSEQVISLGKGESEPLIPKQGEAYFAINRRVEFHLQRQSVQGENHDH